MIRAIRAHGRVGALAAVIAVVLALAWIIVSPASGAQTLRFFARYSEAESGDVDHNGDGDGTDLGEGEAGSFKLRQEGDPAGHLEFRCIHTHVSPLRDMCVGTVRVTGKGLITVQSLQSENADEIKVAVTGGTGAYRGASGVLRLSFRRTGARVTIEID